MPKANKEKSIWNIDFRNKTFSQSNDRIFEHPEITIKPSTIDERAQRRAMMTTLPFNSSENGGGSVPNILQHPDMPTPFSMNPQHISSPSSSSTSSSNGRKTLVRQQSGNENETQWKIIDQSLCFSADVYSTLTRTKSPHDDDRVTIFIEKKRKTVEFFFVFRANRVVRQVRPFPKPKNRFKLFVNIPKWVRIRIRTSIEIWRKKKKVNRKKMISGEDEKRPNWTFSFSLCSSNFTVVIRIFHASCT